MNLDVEPQPLGTAARAAEHERVRLCGDDALGGRVVGKVGPSSSPDLQHAARRRADDEPPEWSEHGALGPPGYQVVTGGEPAVSLCLRSCGRSNLGRLIASMTRLWHPAARRRGSAGPG